MGSHIAGLYFYDHPGTNNFILGFAILVMGDLIGSGGGYCDGGDDAEGGGGGGGSIVGDSNGGGYGDAMVVVVVDTVVVVVVMIEVLVKKVAASDNRALTESRGHLTPCVANKITLIEMIRDGLEHLQWQSSINFAVVVSLF